MNLATRSVNVDEVVPAWYQGQEPSFRRRILNMRDYEFEEATAAFEIDMREKGVERVLGDVRDCLKFCAEEEFGADDK